MKTSEKKPGILILLLCRCPRCRRGNMFENKNPYVLKETMKMNRNCPVCDQPFNIEVGFYYGSSYISYAAAIVLSGLSLAAWWLVVGLSLSDNRFFYWLLFNAVFLITLQPYLMRVARTLWLAFFVYYDRDWMIHIPKRPERTNEEQENNW